MLPAVPSRLSGKVLAGAAILVVVAGFLVWRLGFDKSSGGVPLELVDPGVALTGEGAPPEESARADPTRPATVTVQVTGPVVRPGLVVLPHGARVADALAAAGGLRPEAPGRGMNLARVLTDGEQIDFGTPPPTATQPTGSATTGPLDLNTASAEQLDELPGVGPVLAERIISYRTENGRFESVEQLQEVPGIGASRLANLADLVTVARG